MTFAYISLKSLEPLNVKRCQAGFHCREIGNMISDFEHLYIHIPFCQQKCGYCAFYSEADPASDQIAAYLDHLGKEFSNNSSRCSELTSIYLGGGTPSLLSSKRLSHLFGMITANFAIAEDAEITMECNPESLEDDKAAVIADFTNRISLGIQSFNSKFRQMIGRQGDIEVINQVMDMLTLRGIKNIGVDLIYAIPGESIQNWQTELQQASDLPIKHISSYSLSYEEGTSLYQGRNLSSNEDHLEKEAGMWELAGKFLAQKGLQRYEISNYAKTGYECKHNNAIWYGDTYLGCGPAATSFDGTDRWTNPASLKQWLAGDKAVLDRIAPEQRAREIFVMGLRATKGWHFRQFQEKTGFDCRTWMKELNPIINHGLLLADDKKIFCSPRGFLLWNEIAEALF